MTLSHYQHGRLRRIDASLRRCPRAAGSPGPHFADGSLYWSGPDLACCSGHTIEYREEDEDG